MQEKYYIQDSNFDDEYKILKNKLAVTDQNELLKQEENALIEAFDKLAIEYSDDHVFTSSDVLYINKIFLEGIYDWAGTVRTVDLSSKDVRWCHAKFIDNALEDYSKQLSQLTPFSSNLKREEIIKRLAVIHGELVVIHPFRDGNGRTTRLLCDLLLMQSERRPLKREVFYDKDLRGEYYKAIQNIWRKASYEKLEAIFSQLVPE